jgi:hypothetical protein
MRPEAQIPSAQDALHYFQAMAAGGRLPKTETRKRALYGSWGGGGPSVLKISPTMKQPIVETILVTPTAMALEQAKSQLREAGEEIPATQRGLKISPTMKQPIVETILVTPTARALEQAISQLREAGEEIPGEEIPATQRGKTGH